MWERERGEGVMGEEREGGRESESVRERERGRGSDGRRERERE